MPYTTRRETVVHIIQREAAARITRRQTVAQHLCDIDRIVEALLITPFVGESDLMQHHFTEIALEVQRH